jgi:hypothetical protein
MKISSVLSISLIPQPVAPDASLIDHACDFGSMGRGFVLHGRTLYTVEGCKMEKTIGDKCS